MKNNKSNDIFDIERVKEGLKTMSENKAFQELMKELSDK